DRSPNSRTALLGRSAVRGCRRGRGPYRRARRGAGRRRLDERPGLLLKHDADVAADLVVGRHGAVAPSKNGAVYALEFGRHLRILFWTTGAYTPTIRLICEGRNRRFGLALLISDVRPPRSSDCEHFHVKGA